MKDMFHLIDEFTSRRYARWSVEYFDRLKANGIRDAVDVIVENIPERERERFMGYLKWWGKENGRCD